MFDGDGQPVPDCMLEIWQADAQGRFCRSAGQAGAAEFVVQGVRPLRHRCEWRLCLRHHQAGQVPDPDGKPQAPHLLLAVFARGMLLQNYSRIYFGGEAANAADPVLALVPIDRRATLIAQQANCNGNAVYRLDIHLQGDNETVFFDV